MALRKRMNLRALSSKVISSLILLVTPLQSLLAQGTQKALSGLEEANKKAELPDVGGGDIPTLIGEWLGVILGFTGTIFFILVVWAGLTWMTAGGNEENIKKAQGILKTAVIGLIIVLSAYAITRFIGTSLLQ